jgi:hypothetical protein
MQHHKWSITEIENMMPWERAIYTLMLEDWLKSERDRIKMEAEQAKNIQDANARRAKNQNNRKRRR